VLLDNLFLCVSVFLIANRGSCVPVCVLPSSRVKVRLTVDEKSGLDVASGSALLAQLPWWPAFVQWWQESVTQPGEVTHLLSCSAT
jgi:hypothetical protein